ncbi:hypothetical protein KM043_002776 [Ampulex compressa]|nr:hypothetical protein KM043_002776 [Ampulex compressa]
MQGHARILPSHKGAKEDGKVFLYVRQGEEKNAFRLRFVVAFLPSSSLTRKSVEKMQKVRDAIGAPEAPETPLTSWTGTCSTGPRFSAICRSKEGQQGRPEDARKDQAREGGSGKEDRGKEEVDRKVRARKGVEGGQGFEWSRQTGGRWVAMLVGGGDNEQI